MVIFCFNFCILGWNNHVSFAVKKTIFFFFHDKVRRLVIVVLPFNSDFIIDRRENLLAFISEYPFILSFCYNPKSASIRIYIIVIEWNTRCSILEQKPNFSSFSHFNEPISDSLNRIYIDCYGFIVVIEYTIFAVGLNNYILLLMWSQKVRCLLCMTNHGCTYHEK